MTEHEPVKRAESVAIQPARSHCEAGFDKPVYALILSCPDQLGVVAAVSAYLLEVSS